MIKHRIMLVAVAATMTVAGCGASGSEGKVATKEPAGSNAPKTTTTTEEEATSTTEKETSTTEKETTTTTEEATTTTTAPQNPKFGQSYEWEDGLSVTIGAPAPFTPSEYALSEGASAYLSFEVKIVNGTTGNFDPSLFSSTLQSGNAEASQVYDSEFESLSTTLLAGREAVFKIGYGVSDPADLVLEVSPDFDHDSVIFTT